MKTRSKTVILAVKPVTRSVRVNRVEETRYEFTREQVLAALCVAGLLPEPLDLGIAEKGNITEQIELFMRIPGGGDYSNSNLDVATDCPLVVTVKQESNT